MPWRGEQAGAKCADVLTNGQHSDQEEPEGSQRQNRSLLVHGCVQPNVRGNAGPAVGRQAREAEDSQSRLAGLLARRWASR